MLKAFGLLIIFIIIIVAMIVIAIIGGFIKIFRAGGNNRSNRSQSPFGSNTTEPEMNTHQKEFKKEEGEYVDFEEIKDDRK